MQLHILPRPPADNQVLFVIFFPVLFGLFFVDSIAIFVVTSHDNTRPPEHGQDEEEDYDQDCREDSTETTKKIMNKTVKKSSRPAQFLQKKNLPRPGAAANTVVLSRSASTTQATGEPCHCAWRGHRSRTLPSPESLDSGESSYGLRSGASRPCCVAGLSRVRDSGLGRVQPP